MNTFLALFNILLCLVLFGALYYQQPGADRKKSYKLGFILGALSLAFFQILLRTIWNG